MPRFFVEDSAIKENVITLTGDDAHHISYALRMAVGDEITVTNGKGRAYLCRLAAMDGVTVEAEILGEADDRTESPVEIHLFQAYPKADKLEFIIQKAVELGVSLITPFESERCIKRPKADKVAHVLDRQRRIATEAAKQSGRAHLPTVNAPVSFSAMLNEASAYPLALFCHPSDATVSLRATLAEHKDVRRIAIVVGSEGGFSESEVAAAENAGLIPTSLGARVLRCETAPLFLLSAIAYEYELPVSADFSSL